MPPKKSPVIFVCKYCKCMFLDQVEFVAHKRAEHGEQFTTDYSYRSYSRRMPKTPSTSKAILKPSVNPAARQLSSESHRLYDKPGSVNEGGRRCRFCPAMLPANQLSNHEREHTGEEPYQCMHCLKGFPEKSEAEEHEVVCPVLDILKEEAHSKRGHSGTHRCEICGKCCKSKSTLLQHQLSHSEEKPFACPQCQASFKYSQNLTRHLQQLHPESTTAISSATNQAKVEVTASGPCPSKALNRGTAGATTVQDDKLNSAVNGASHFPRRRVEGEKALPRPAVLRQHLLDPNKFSLGCSTCGLQFRDERILEHHINGHLKRLPFLCIHCGHWFRRSHQVKEHLKKQHSESTLESTAKT